MADDSYSFEDYSFEAQQWAALMGIGPEELAAMSAGSPEMLGQSEYDWSYSVDEFGGYYDEYGSYWEPSPAEDMTPYQVDAQGGYYDEYGTYWQPGPAEDMTPYQVDAQGGYYDEYGTYWQPDQPVPGEQFFQEMEAQGQLENAIKQAGEDYWTPVWDSINTELLASGLPAVDSVAAQKGIFEKAFGTAGFSMPGGGMSIGGGGGGGGGMSAGQIASFVKSLLAETGGAQSTYYKPVQAQSTALSTYAIPVAIGAGILALAAFSGGKRG